MTSRPVALRSFLEANRQFGNLLQRVRESQRTIHQVRKILPIDLRPHLSAALRDGDRLVLFADSPVWASRLRFAVPVLRVSLEPVRHIRIRVAPSGGSSSRIRMEPGPRFGAMSPQNAAQIRTIAATVSDPELSGALRRLASHVREAEE